MPEALMNGEDFEEDVVDGEPVEQAGVGEEEEIFACSSDAAGAESSFDLVMSHLENIMMDEGFNAQISGFMTTHCGEFDDGEENKLRYTELFEEYVGVLDKYIESRLGAAFPDFNIKSFCADLLKNKDTLELDLDTLGAFGDFEAFKAMMLACKRGKALEEEGGGPLQIVGGKAALHTDDMEDGEEMPDLNLSISGVKVN